MRRVAWILAVLTCAAGCDSKDPGIDFPKHDTQDLGMSALLVGELTRDWTPDGPQSIEVLLSIKESVVGDPTKLFRITADTTVVSGDPPAAGDPIFTLGTGADAQTIAPNARNEIIIGADHELLTNLEIGGAFTYSPRTESTWTTYLKVDAVGNDVVQRTDDWTLTTTWGPEVGGTLPDAVATDYADNSYPVDIDIGAGSVNLTPAGKYTNDFTSSYMGVAKRTSSQWTAAGTTPTSLWSQDFDYIQTKALGSWSELVVPGADQLGDFAWNGTLWVIADTNVGIWLSDGNTVTAASGPSGAVNLACGPASCAATTNAGFLYSLDSGDSWSASGSNEIGNDIAYGNGSYVSFDVFNAQVVHSEDDGATWSAGTFPDAYGFARVAFGGGTFAAVRSDGVFYSDDGISWTAGSISGAPGLEDLAYSAEAGAFIGYYQSDLYLSADGKTWTAASGDVQPATIFQTISGF